MWHFIGLLECLNSPEELVWEKICGSIPCRSASRNLNKIRKLFNEKLFTSLLNAARKVLQFSILYCENTSMHYRRRTWIHINVKFEKKN